jgi:pimeloyl-ACP methyl ester carboxylesterase
MKTTLVLLPGLNGTTGLFAPLIEAAKGHFSVLPVNYPALEEKTYQELTALVLLKLGRLEGKYILVGESFSGPVALFVSQTRPAGLIGVVLVATFVRAPNWRIGRLLPWRLGFSLAKPLYSIRMAFSGKGNRALVYNISVEMQKVAPRVLSARIASIFNVDASDALRACHVPLMYFRGVRDLVVPAKNLAAIRAIRADIHVVELNTQHFLLQSMPERVVSEIARFYQSAEREQSR